MAKILTGGPIVFCLWVFGVQCALSFDLIQYVKNGPLPVCSVEILNITISEKSLGLVRLLLMHSENEYSAYPLQESTQLLQNPVFNKSLRTVIFAHGFTQTATSGPSKQLTSAYLALKHCNVIMLDSFPLISHWYLKSVTAVTRIGTTLGRELYNLSLLGFQSKTLDLVGHSLGAHIMGFAAKEYYRLSGCKVPSISALDPAGPCYRDVPTNRRLDKEDADFVQIIHTNGGYLGIMKPMGHSDFYVNGGRLQQTGIFLIPNVIISHERSVDLWYYSIKYFDGFVGSKCSSMMEVELGQCSGKENLSTMMGPWANPKKPGIYYVITSDKPPYLTN